jgi:hypothetical protein
VPPHESRMPVLQPPSMPLAVTLRDMVPASVEKWAGNGLARADPKPSHIAGSYRH